LPNDMNPLPNLPPVQSAPAPAPAHDHTVREGQTCPTCNRVKEYATTKPGVMPGKGTKIRVMATKSRGRKQAKDARKVRFY
jgi:hypothetical protein